MPPAVFQREGRLDEVSANDHHRPDEEEKYTDPKIKGSTRTIFARHAAFNYVVRIVLDGRTSIFRNDKWEDTFAHGGHNITIVVGDNTLEKGNGSLHLGLRDEAKDTQLCQSSVVDLGPEALLLLLLGHVLVAAKGIVQVEGTAGDELGIKGGKFADLSTLHVVLLGGNLAPLLWGERRYK